MIHKISNNFWKNKNVFITGHTGFKGSWLSIFLKFLGAKVTGYSLKPENKPNLFEMAKIGSLIDKSIISDIRDYKKLYQCIKKSKATILFHLAAQPLVRYSYLEPKETYDTNFSGSLNILEIVRKLKTVKTSIIITTDKVYDNKKNKIFKETDLLGGYDPYSNSKVCVEFLFDTYLHSFFEKQTQKKLATVRAGNVIGGGDYSEDRLIPDIFRFYKKQKDIILRNPKSTRPWQHVLEPLGGYLLLAEKLHLNKLKSNYYSWNFGPNLPSCETVSYIAKYFAKRLKMKINYLKKSKNVFKPETSFLRLSNYKARKVLKWKPKWNLNYSLEKILEWNIKINKKNAQKLCFEQIKEYLYN